MNNDNIDSSSTPSTMPVVASRDTTGPDLTPTQIVEYLDRYIIGQKQAKRVVAIALRNRARRARVQGELQDEIIPKNILMIGPTGVGKTEIARRLSTLMSAPFIKVEATKYTEVGYVGRDVESMVRDLVESAVRMVKTMRREAVEASAEAMAVEIILDAMTHQRPRRRTVPAQGEFTVAEQALDDESDQITRLRERLRRKILAGEMDGNEIEIEVTDSQPKMVEIFSNAGIEEMGVNLQDMLGGLMPSKKRKRKTTVAEAKKILTAAEADKLIDMDDVAAEAVNLVEQQGIIFIDEIDKIAGREKSGSGPDVSREGVQRDILPIVEGSTVTTKYGPVKTNHVLFIAAGAFSYSKPSDLIPELQGRFPLRVELENLSRDDFRRILTEPKNALIKQYIALLGADGVNLEFTDDGIDEIADAASRVNQQTENIGARRLHTMLEKALEDISFNAPDIAAGHIVIDKNHIRESLKDIVDDVDLSRYIL